MAKSEDPMTIEVPDLADIILERRQSALIATLNRPKAKNALTAEMVEGLISLCDWLTDQKDIRILVLRGADGCFCAGGDIKDFGKQLFLPEAAPGEIDPVAKGNRVFGDLLLKLDALPQVFIAQIEGAAFGGANGFISVADIAIAETNTRFSLSETTLGVPPAQIGPFVVRKIGLFNARRIALSGAHFSANEAMRIGLVDRLVTGAAGLETALVESLNAIGRCEPEANAATKQILNAAGGFVDPAQLDKAAAAFAVCLRGRGKDGAMAFAAKKAPDWIETFAERGEA